MKYEIGHNSIRRNPRMRYVHYFLPTGSAILLFGYSQLMMKSTKDSRLGQIISALFLALSVVAAAVAIAMLING